jgi:hypothetical protein
MFNAVGGRGALDTPRPLNGIERNLLYTGPHESRSIGNTASLGLFAVHKIVSEYAEKIQANRLIYFTVYINFRFFRNEIQFATEEFCCAISKCK